MKVYKVYVLKGQELEREDTFFGCSALKVFLNDESLKHQFVVVNYFFQPDSENEPEAFRHSSIYLDGVQLKRMRHKADEKDIELAKRKLTTIYHADGSRTYFPDGPLSTPEVKEICGGWFTMSIAKETPQRWVIVYYDHLQYDAENKPFNKTASKKFKRDLYGDVLFINENFVA